jgi:hypothetical protein
LDFDAAEELTEAYGYGIEPFHTNEEKAQRWSAYAG